MMIGYKITQPDDPLTKTTPEHIIRTIQNPDQKLMDAIGHLRNLKTIDEKSYKNFKKNLPYFVCGNFHPPFRKKENFASTQYFIADFDNLHKASLSAENLKKLLASDQRVLAAFISPGNDGLKVIFKLNALCKDPGMYKVVYTNFLQSFASEYNVLLCLDKVTNDVTRATFLSFDPDIFHNPNATPIQMELFLNSTDVLIPLKTSAVQIESIENADKNPPLPDCPDPDEQTLTFIKNLLRDKKNPQPDKIITPSQKVHDLIPLIEKFLLDIHCKIIQRKTIHYGEQITLSNGKSIMEFNIFHGKKGFSVVVNPRSGTNHALASEFRSILVQAINTLNSSNLSS